MEEEGEEEEQEEGDLESEDEGWLLRCCGGAMIIIAKCSRGVTFFLALRKPNPASSSSPSMSF